MQSFTTFVELSQNNNLFFEGFTKSFHINQQTTLCLYYLLPLPQLRLYAFFHSYWAILMALRPAAESSLF